MNQENILSQSKQKFLSEALVTSMNRGNPFPVSVNCRTFHSFVFFGLMDPDVYEAMDQNDDQPWREEENWDRWGISRDDDRLRQEEFAFFQMHCDKCLKQYNYKVKLHPLMGLGLFARSPELTYYHLDPEDLVHGLYGFLEFLNDEEIEWYNATHHPSLYSDRDDNQGILYGPLYFCNHQDWAPPLEDLNPMAKGFQVLLKTQECMTVNAIVVDNQVETVTDYENSEVSIDRIDLPKSQDIDYSRQDIYGDDFSRTIIKEHGQSYWIVKLDPDDPFKRISEEPYTTDFSTQIFANYGGNFLSK